MGGFLRPRAVNDALAALADRPYTVLAGGTDFYPAHVGRMVDDDVLDITALDELRGIRESAQGFRIGALVTWSDLLAADLPPAFDGLKRAAREIGGEQIQNRGTLCGNVCNASPAADGIPNLLVLDAEVELCSAAGVRRLAVADFVEGNRATARRADELMTAVLVPKLGPGARATFLKLGARRYLVISIVMIAALIETDAQSVITRARLAVGACTARALRLEALERALIGSKLSPDVARIVCERHLSQLSPIDDIRGTADYRRVAALVLARRALGALAEPRP